MTERIGMPSRSWTTLALEGSVIVLGIIIALGAEALWDWSQDRRDEQVALRHLAEDFRKNAAQFDTTVAWHRGTRAATLVLMESFTAGQVLESDSLRSLVRRITNWWTFDPNDGALESLLYSGQFALIQDDSLSLELAAWPGLLRDYREEEDGVGAVVTDFQSDYLMYHLDYGALFLPEIAGEDLGLGELASDPVFRNFIARRYSWTPDLFAEAETVRMSLQRIRTLIDRNLTDGPGG
jgi:hypothetical protein